MNHGNFRGLVLSEAVQQARRLLPNGPYDSPGLDALVLLCNCLDISKEQYYAQMREPLDDAGAECFSRAVKRRNSGEPVAYILGRKEFYGLDFQVDPRVLIPRPDTEILLDWVLDSHSSRSSLSIHDCCSGSGAVALALAHMRPGWHITASDISRAAGELFEINARNLTPGKPVQWYRSDLLETPLKNNQRFDVISANPPYLTTGETRERENDGWIEPMLALDGGGDGPDFIRRLIVQANNVLNDDGWLYIEAADAQAENIHELLKQQGYADIECKNDLAGMKRISRGRKR